jgi:flagellar basal-body rod protein FlgF
MDNSLLVSLSHQLASYRAMDVIANNIANASTPGFKREAAKFEEFVTMMRPAEGQTGLQAVSFVKDAGVMRDTARQYRADRRCTYDVAIAGLVISRFRPRPACAIPATAISPSTITAIW